MANTERYQELKDRTSELRTNLLPVDFDETGTYPEEVLDKARGYRMLCHAEIEAYLEDVAKQIVQEKIGLFKKKKKSSYVLLCFLAAYHTGWQQEDDPPLCGINSRAKPNVKVAEAIDIASTQYFKTVIGSNNGIKIRHLKSIFIPLGVDFDSVDQDWLNSIEEYGKRRGEVAHNSKKAQKQISPKDEMDEVELVLAGLKDFDSHLHDLANT